MASYIISVVAGYVEVLHDLSATGNSDDKKEALKRARNSLPFGYVKDFQNSVGSSGLLKKLTESLRGMISARIGKDTLQNFMYDKLMGRATRANISNLNTVIKKYSPLLFLVAISVAGWFDELVAFESETAWGIQGEDAVATWFNNSTSRDMTPVKERTDINSENKNRRTRNIRQTFARNLKKLNDEESEAGLWFNTIAKVYLSLLGKQHCQNYSDGGDGGSNIGGGWEMARGRLRFTAQQ